MVILMALANFYLPPWDVNVESGDPFILPTSGYNEYQLLGIRALIIELASPVLKGFWCRHKVQETGRM